MTQIATLFILAAGLTAHTFLGTIIANEAVEAQPRPQPAVREVIHPEGPRGARRYTSRIYNGSERQFKELFRMSRTTFKALARWLKVNQGLTGTRYQTAEQKLMVEGIMQYILASALVNRGLEVLIEFRIREYWRILNEKIRA